MSAHVLLMYLVNELGEKYKDVRLCQASYWFSPSRLIISLI